MNTNEFSIDKKMGLLFLCKNVNQFLIILLWYVS